MSRHVEDIVEYLERLVLIKFSDEEREKLRKEVSKILEFFNTLMEVKDLDKYEPLYYVHDVAGPYREDEIDTRRIIDLKDLEVNAVIENRYVRAPRTVAE